MKLLTNRTADKIRQRVLDVSPPVGDDTRQKDTLGGRSVLVRCTSATPANSSGVGAQCYPGIIVDPRASATSQTERGVVWLTLYGDGMLPKKPRSGAVYDCILLGNVEAATADSRPRAVSVTGAASKPSADCSSWLGLLRLGTCATLSITEATGACACIDTQTADLTWDDDENVLTSDDLLYGCPLGVITSLCPDGAPRKWSSLFAGFTGVYAILNGGWTWTYTAGNTWVATKSGITATLVMTAGLNYSITFSGGTSAVNALQYTVSGDAGCCDAVTLTKV